MPLRPLVLALSLALLPALPATLRADDTPASPGLAVPLAQNPVLAASGLPFEAPALDRIAAAHFQPAIEAAMARHRSELAAIAATTAPPDFANTIEALERSGGDLRRAASLFSNLNGAQSTPELQALATQLMPALAAHQAAIYLDAGLFARIQPLYAARDTLDLTPEQRRVLERYYTLFQRGGAALSEQDKATFKANADRMATLSVRFSQNLLKDTNAFLLRVDDRARLAGLPEAEIAAAAALAKARGFEGEWAFSLQKPSLIPALTYAEDRDLRRALYQAYVNRGNNGDAQDNKALIAELVKLRAANAQLLGHATWADFVLAENMAKTPAAVDALLGRLWTPAVANARREADALAQLAAQHGHEGPIEGWDWWYWAERLRRAEYALDDAELRPYFKLEHVRDGAFEVARRLWGITFHARPDLPVYHPDVQAFEVRNPDGSHLGLLYTDYSTRDGKRPGAWASNFRPQSTLLGQTPIIVNVCNVPRPDADGLVLLGLDDVNTLFHEFGHALHGLFSSVTYPSLAGTAVPRDFVEFPSQIMENWAEQREVLKQFARHHSTGEAIPDALLDKLEKARRFNQGFAATEYLAAAILDLRYHTLREPGDLDVAGFERRVLQEIGLPPAIAPRYTSTNFAHVFAGGYSAGYYAYIWAETLDADGFQAFRDAGLFDAATAARLRDRVLSQGGNLDAAEAYRAFRGNDPSVDALLDKRGLKPVIDDEDPARSAD